MAKREPATRDTKERILDAALDVFAERGYHAATIDEIAARANCTKGAVYYYFSDKDDLARDIRRGIWTRLKERALATVDPDAPVIDVLDHAFAAYLDALQELGVAKFFLRDVWALPARAGEADDERESGAAMLCALLEEGLRRGELAPVDPEATARVLLGAYSEATLHVLGAGDPGPTVAVVRRIVASLAADRARTPARGARA